MTDDETKEFIERLNKVIDLAVAAIQKLVDAAERVVNVIIDWLESEPVQRLIERLLGEHDDIKDGGSPTDCVPRSDEEWLND